VFVCLRKRHRRNWYMPTIDNWKIECDDACRASPRIAGYYFQYGFPDRCLRFECFYNVLLYRQRLKSNPNILQA
jgi:hypothetical protein